MIVFEKIEKIFDKDRQALQNISFKIEKGETLVLLGRSGSGKTTALKMINRMIDPTSGRILIDGEDIQLLDPIELRRQIGYAVQHVGLFEHMTIEENISVVPKLLHWSKESIDNRVDELLSLLGFTPDLIRKRYPQQLSGGQRQRIGVARALAADPPILLMDEAFAALDPITKEQVQNEFLELESEIKKTVVFVTHDLFEAVKIGDRIALMDGGKIVQIATPFQLVNHPANSFVKQFLGDHQFQLMLMTKTIDNCQIPLIGGDRVAGPFLTLKSSLSASLDLFNEKEALFLPVYHKKDFIGLMDKKDLMRCVINILQDQHQEVTC